MQMITVVTPCYNEEKNVRFIYEKVKAVFCELKAYRYEHLFIDNASSDHTVKELRKLVDGDKNVKVIINARNFGPVRSPYYGLLQAQGDAVVLIAADMQEPPELIIEFVKHWEAGCKIVAGVKNSSQESVWMFYLRKLYYRFIAKIADIQLIKNFTGFGLYDKEVITIFRKIDDPYPYLRGLVSELGLKIVQVPYMQPLRLHGKTNANFFILYDWLMLGITSHSKLPIRLMTIAGFFLAFISFFISMAFLILKLIFWNSFSLGTAPLLVGLFFFSSVQLFFMGLLGEYVLSVNTRVIKRPLVIEEARINFDSVG